MRERPPASAFPFCRNSSDFSFHSRTHDTLKGRVDPHRGGCNRAHGRKRKRGGDKRQRHDDRKEAPFSTPSFNMCQRDMMRQRSAAERSTLRQCLSKRSQSREREREREKRRDRRKLEMRNAVLGRLTLLLRRRRNDEDGHEGHAHCKHRCKHSCSRRPREGRPRGEGKGRRAPRAACPEPPQRKGKRVGVRGRERKRILRPPRSGSSGMEEEGRRGKKREEEGRGRG